MGLSVSTLRQHIAARKQSLAQPQQIKLGKGFFIEPDRNYLVIYHEDEPEDKATCGYIDALHDSRWTLLREWREEIIDIFGGLPENLIIEGDEI